jgi:glycosyltransferase involved in cell wall biosynthesis
MLSQFYSTVIGGEERHVAALSQALVARGHQVAVATLQLDGLAAEEDEGPVPVHRVRSSAQRLPVLFSDPSRPHVPPLPDPHLAWGLRRVARAVRPDVIHAHNWIVNAALPLRAASPAALVLTLHDYSHVCATKRMMRAGAPCPGPALGACLRCAGDHYGRALGPAVALATRPLRPLRDHFLDGIIAVSRTVAEGNRLEGARVPHRVIPNFIADELWEEAGSPLSPVPHPALPTEPFLFFAGDLSRDKGVPALLEAYARLERRPRLVLAGRRTPDTPATLPEGAVLLPDCPHKLVMEGFHRCLAALAPSTWPDPCPTVVLEAMASGAPLIASAIGGIRDMVVDGESGLLVTPGDVDELAAALRRLLGDPSLRLRLTEGGRARALGFTASRVVPRIEDAYAAALHSRRLSREGK